MVCTYFFEALKKVTHRTRQLRGKEGKSGVYLAPAGANFNWRKVGPLPLSTANFTPFGASTHLPERLNYLGQTERTGR